jgi:hypothetical protein
LERSARSARSGGCNRTWRRASRHNGDGRVSDQQGKDNRGGGGERGRVAGGQVHRRRRPGAQELATRVGKERERLWYQVGMGNPNPNSELGVY